MALPEAAAAVFSVRTDALVFEPPADEIAAGLASDGRISVMFRSSSFVYSSSWVIQDMRPGEPG
jgi:hypothetical protein